MAEEAENELQRSLVYWVSRRGRASYWASLINGTDKKYTNEQGTLSVQLTPNFRYLLTCHLPFFETCSPAMKYLVLVHEAAHIALNHIPRLFKLLANCTDPFVRTAVLATFNFAADFAANDSIVRLEPEFTAAHKAFNHVDPITGERVILTPEEEKALKGEFPFLIPEEWGFPAGKSMEEYIVLILKDLPAFKKQIKQALKNLAKSMSDGGTGEGAPGEKPQRGRGGSKVSSVPGLSDALIQHALNEPETFDMMQEAFDKLTKGAHKSWNEMAKQMTPEEALSAGNKMKNHAKSLARSANERVKRDRGFMSGRAQAIIDALLEPEQIPWDAFLKDIIQGCISARVQEDMVSPNLALINEDYMEPWPGQTLEFGFQITWFTDTSGSMGDDEYARACACLNSLLAANKAISVTYVECDAALQKESKISNVEPPDDAYLKELRNRRGYGGTTYTPFFKRVLGLDAPEDWVAEAPRLEDAHPRPDLIVICTDGGVAIEGECFPKYHPGCPIIWLVMPGCTPATGMSNVAPDRVVEMFKMREDET